MPAAPGQLNPPVRSGDMPKPHAAATKPAEPAADGRSAPNARYLYAVCRRIDARALEGVEGLGGEHLELVGLEQLTAVVSNVSLEEFGEAPLRRNLEDLSWLENVVSA